MKKEVDVPHLFPTNQVICKNCGMEKACQILHVWKRVYMRLLSVIYVPIIFGNVMDFLDGYWNWFTVVYKKINNKSDI